MESVEETKIRKWERIKHGVGEDKRTFGGVLGERKFQILKKYEQYRSFGNHNEKGFFF